MKLATALWFICLAAYPVFSLGQSRTDTGSLIAPKVLIINNDKEILLVYDKNRNAFEVPGTVISGPLPFTKAVDTILAEAGIIGDSTSNHRIPQFEMGGLFTYVTPRRFGIILRPYLVVRLVNFTGTIKNPDYKWFSVKDAIDEIPYPASSLIVDRIFSDPNKVWAATFEEYGYTNPVDRSKVKFRVIEDFYQLNK